MEHDYKRDWVKEEASAKDYADPRDDWLSCPECGSANAVVISGGYDAVAGCPECGNNTIIYEE